MKKVGVYVFVIFLSFVVFLLGFKQNISKQPNIYYQVYLDDELIGMIESKQELEDYINTQAESIRENIKQYKLILDAVDTFNKYNINYDSSLSNLEKANEILSSNEGKLSDLDKENLNYYKEKKLYNLSL